MTDLVITDSLGGILVIYPLGGETEAIVKNGLTLRELSPDSYTIDPSDGRLILRE
jgi:hypothetical protein